MQILSVLVVLGLAAAASATILIARGGEGWENSYGNGWNNGYSGVNGWNNGWNGNGWNNNGWNNNGWNNGYNGNGWNGLGQSSYGLGGNLAVTTGLGSVYGSRSLLNSGLYARSMLSTPWWTGRSYAYEPSYSYSAASPFVGLGARSYLPSLSYASPVYGYLAKKK